MPTGVYKRGPKVEKEVRSLTKAARNDLAAIGAAIRVTALVKELRMILRAYPSVKESLPSQLRVVSSEEEAEAVPHDAGDTKRRKTQKSAAYRKLLSARMKKYWAARKAGEKKE